MAAAANTPASDPAEPPDQPSDRPSTPPRAPAPCSVPHEDDAPEWPMDVVGGSPATSPPDEEPTRARETEKFSSFATATARGPARSTSGAPAGPRACVLVAFGAFDPLHRGHIDMLVRARRTLESRTGDEPASFRAIGGFVVPAHAACVSSKARCRGAPGDEGEMTGTGRARWRAAATYALALARKEAATNGPAEDEPPAAAAAPPPSAPPPPAPHASSSHRLELARLAIAGARQDDWIRVASWAARQPARASDEAAVDALDAALHAELGAARAEGVAIFTVFGSDRVVKVCSGKWWRLMGSLWSPPRRGIVCVPRSGDEELLRVADAPGALVFWVRPPPAGDAAGDAAGDDAAGDAAGDDDPSVFSSTEARAVLAGASSDVARDRARVVLGEATCEYAIALGLYAAPSAAAS